MDDHTAHEHMHHQQQDPSPPPQMQNDNNPYYQIDSTLELQIQELPQQQQKADNEENECTPPAATVMKPHREVLKDENGRFVCTWVSRGDSQV